MGGMQAANSYVKLNLSLFDLLSARACAQRFRPRLMLLPGNFIYQMSSWTRAIVIPLSIVHAFDPKRPVPDGFDLKELFLPGVECGVPATTPQTFSWHNFFVQVDALAEALGEARAEEHPAEGDPQSRSSGCWSGRQHSDGLAAIYPPMMYAIMALDLLGLRAGQSRSASRRSSQFNRLMVDDGERFFFQPCFSVVWDTAIAAHALGEVGGLPEAMLCSAPQTGC